MRPFARLDQEVLDASQLRRVNRAAAQKRERGAARLPFEIARRAGCIGPAEASSALPGRHHVHAQALGIGGEVGVMVLVANVNASQPQRGKAGSRRRADVGVARGRIHCSGKLTQRRPSRTSRTRADSSVTSRPSSDPLKVLNGNDDLDAPGLYEGRPAGTSELKAFDRDVTGNEVVADAGVADGHAERGTRRVRPISTSARSTGGRWMAMKTPRIRATERHQPPPDPPPQPRPARFVRLLIPAHRSILPSFVGAHAVRPPAELKLGPSYGLPELKRPCSQ